VAHRGRESADDRIAYELAAGRTAREAAAATGVSERTIHRRMADPAFRARTNELRSGMISTAAGRLADGMTGAADALLDLMQNTDTNMKFRAAVKVVELGLKVGELAELQRRVDDLERRLTGGRRRDASQPPA
jgi:hypothetical protein